MAESDAILSVLQEVVQAINGLNETVKNVFPREIGTSPTATAGAGGALPATVQAYLDSTEPVTGNPIRIPYYLP